LTEVRGINEDGILREGTSGRVIIGQYEAFHSQLNGLVSLVTTAINTASS
jgi:hypothetical protein